MIEARHKPSGLAARALIRAGSGHKYWSAFKPTSQREIENIAKQIYDILYDPSLETPIKTLDLPIAGRGYSADSVRLLFDFVNLANDITRAKAKEGRLEDDSDGSSTVRFLKNVRKIAARIAGNSPGSLGLHPFVYFYGATGRFQPATFLAIAMMIKDLEGRNGFATFTERRSRFEEILLKYRYFTNQIVTKFGSGVRSQEPLFRFYQRILDGIGQGDSEKVVAEALLGDKYFGLKEIAIEDRKTRGTFSTETKSAVFLRSAIESAVRCKICDARMHRKSISVDHIRRKQDGGRGTLSNAQLSHPYCNTGFKERKVARTLKQRK